MMWKMDQNVVSQTFGSYSTATLACATTTATGFLTSGWASTSTIALTATTATAGLKQGDTITIANIFAANPQNRAAYGSNRLRSFVVQADVTVATSGTTSVIVSPAVITAGQFQNVVVNSTSATAVRTPKTFHRDDHHRTSSGRWSTPLHLAAWKRMDEREGGRGSHTESQHSPPRYSDNNVPGPRLLVMVPLSKAGAGAFLSMVRLT